MSAEVLDLARVANPQARSSPNPIDKQPAVARFAAGTIDLSIVILPTLAVVFFVSERFRFVRDPSGRPTFSAEDQLRIDQLSGGTSRAQEVGDTLYTLSGSGFWLTIGVFLLLVAGVFGLGPTALASATPGRWLLRWRGGSASTNHGDETEPDRSAPKPAASNPPLAEPKATRAPTPAADSEVTSQADQAPPPVETNPTKDTKPPIMDFASAVAPPLAKTVPLPKRSRPAPAVTENGAGDVAKDLVERASERYPVPAARPGRNQAANAAAASTVQDEPTPASVMASLDLLGDGAFSLDPAKPPPPLPRSVRDASAWDPTPSGPSAPEKEPTSEAALASPLSPVSGAAEEPRPQRRKPLWSEGWQAWIYFDAAADQWFRHEANAWVPMDGDSTQ